MYLRIATVLLTPAFALAQVQPPDVLEQALVSTFKRDNGNLVCLSTQGTLQNLRDAMQPYVKGVDIASPESYRTLVLATYLAFPCPFSPRRSELRPALAADVIGSWVFPDGSLKLRHGPKSPAWRAVPGVAPIKCEGVAFHEGGEYRVTQIRGSDATCPTLASMDAMRAVAPRVQSWSLMQNGRIRIDRTDVPDAFEEWDVFAVLTPFEFFGVKFAVGDLAAYQRKGRGNDINAAQSFRHLQRLN
ncbi:hypothetical protein [Pelomonas sp. Root1444]|uniref:hypothetical protein n=1 Tax=Pelomonas sp. Root1444 TaxID=1736464 RepID=UPI00070276F7|nr:hypothetical protein [Pelomonas sp. Root1444]KQY88296.1 hypothetical protein ASD35_11950 [Pelomonas sp. Root1444]